MAGMTNFAIEFRCRGFTVKVTEKNWEHSCHIYIHNESVSNKILIFKFIAETLMEFYNLTNDTSSF